MAEPNVKGVAFRTVVKVVEKRQEREVVEKAFAAMPAEVVDGLRFGGIIASGWYPVAWYRAMWKGLLEATGQGDRFVLQVGRDAIDSDLNSIYRALLRVLSPRTLVSVGMRHFDQIYDTGRVVVLEPAPKTVRLRFSGCTGFDHAMWVEILGSCERLAELAGGHGAHATILEGGADGQDGCVAAVHWR